MIVLDGITTFSKSFAALSGNDNIGEILIVTSKGVYFRVNNRIFMLSDAALGATPLGIGIDKLAFLTGLDWEVGQKVSLRDQVLYVPGAIIRLKMIQADTSNLQFPLQRELIQKCAQLLQKQCKPNGVSSLCTPLLGLDRKPVTYSNQLCQIAHPLLNALVQALYDCDAEDVNAAVRQLIGMGIGLTPSLDDVILGMLYTLQHVAPEWKATQLLKEAVIRCAPGSTNDISAAYLLAVADGAPFDRLGDVLRGLSGEIHLDIEPILKIGSSSGSEMLLGLLIAAQIIYL